MPSGLSTRPVRALRSPALWTVALAFVLATPMAAQAQAKGKCKNVPMSATFSPIPDVTSTGGLFGQGGVSTFTTYTNGISGTVNLSVCDGTGDFYLNLASGVYFTYDFSGGLLAGTAALLPVGTRVNGWVIKVPHLGNLARYTNEVLDTLLVSTLNAVQLPNGYVANGVAYCDQTTQDCSGPRLALADTPGNTSLIRVTVAPNCSSWTIQPVPVSTTDATNGYPIAGLIDQTSTRGNATLISGGLYSMPFTITLTRYDGVTGCGGLLQ